MTGEQPESEPGPVTGDDRTCAIDGPSSAELLETVLGSTSAAILLVDGESVVFATEAVEQYLGARPDQVVGRPVTAVFPDRVSDRVFRIQNGAKAGTTVSGADWCRGHSDQSATVSVTLEAAPGDRVVATFTDRVEREQSLQTFREAVEQAGHSIYVTDVDGTIQYVNPTFERTTGYSAEDAVGETPAILNSGEHDEAFFATLWETILDGEVWTGEVVNERESGDQYVVNQTIAPIADEAGEIDRFVAINDDITEQKRRERTLRRQRNSLERIRLIMESLRPINRDIARSGTRDEIEGLVCERLTDSEAYLFAWIGGYNSAIGALTLRECAGVDAGLLRDRDIDVNEDTADVFARAVSQREVEARQDVTTGRPCGDDRSDPPDDYQSQAAVPVVYGDTVLGVIGVYSARGDAFDEYERGLLRELGERVGHAITAAENQQLLNTDTVVELEFAVGPDASPVAAVAADCDCCLSLDGVTPAVGADLVTYLEVEGADPSVVVEAFGRRADLTGTRVVEARGETGVVEVTGRFGPVATLVEHGATVRSFEATADGATILGETTPQSDVASLIRDVESHGGVFVAKRTRHRRVQPLALTKTAVEEALTDRQREAVTLAYHAGFFASPRDSTGEDLAATLGISPPTFYGHVREGVRKLLELVVDAKMAGSSAPPDGDG